ncbi:MAG: Zn-dependent hydrolase, partial [Methylotenera sp.]
MFKQLFDSESSTYTYLIVDDQSQEALLIDPVASQLNIYMELLASSNAQLKYAIETHVHADHITASGQLREKLAVQTGVSALCGAESADMQLKDNDILMLGAQQIKVIATPGHTAGSVSYLWNDRIFTGDALLI